MSGIVLNGGNLDLEVLLAVARGDALATLAPEAERAIQAGAETIRRIVADGRRVYGVNTGFGALSTVTIPPERLPQLQTNLLRSHAAGFGPRLRAEVVRAMMLLRANTLARGHSGVRPIVVRRFLDFLDRRIHPIVPAQGSVGASGDLAPLAHLALPLIGEGMVEFRGRDVTAAAALAACDLQPLELAPKEGLALINGTQASVAIGAIAVHDAESLLAHADIVGAMTLQALRGRPRAFDARIQALRPFPGQALVASRLRALLEGSHLTTLDSDSTQDPYSLRCMPQVHGASRDSVAFARRAIDIDLNAVTDNPLVFPDTAEVISGGNFHGEPVAQALDAAAIGLASLAAISERRTDRLVGGSAPGLPPFLSETAGLSSGFMLMHVTAAALTSECKHLASPASVDSIPTSGGKEDHVSFSTYAARKLDSIVANLTGVLAAELLAAAQALDLIGVEAAAPRTRAVHAALRAEIPRLHDDRELSRDLERAARLIRAGHLLTAAGALS